MEKGFGSVMVIKKKKNGLVRVSAFQEDKGSVLQEEKDLVSHRKLTTVGEGWSMRKRDFLSSVLSKRSIWHLSLKDSTFKPPVFPYWL